MSLDKILLFAIFIACFVTFIEVIILGRRMVRLERRVDTARPALDGECAQCGCQLRPDGLCSVSSWHLVKASGPHG